MAINSRLYEKILLGAGVEPSELARTRSQAALSGEIFDQVLSDLGVLDQESLVRVLAGYFRTEFVALENGYDPDALQLLPETLIRKYQILPVALKKDNRLVLAMVNPLDFFAMDYARTLTHYDVEPKGILESHFKRIVEKHFAFQGVESLAKDVSFREVGAAAADAVQAEAGPVAKLVDALFRQAVKMRASDIHLEPQERELIVRFRIDGLLRTVEVLPKQIMPNVISRIKVMAEMDIGERRLPQDGRIEVSFLERNVDLRVSSVPGKYGEKVVLRVLDKTSFLLGLDQLGLSSEIQVRLEEITAEGSGMLLVTGPTGTGKSTTLYTLLDRMRSPAINILTLEDPIEYELLAGKSREAGITQIQINPRIGLTFAKGLRSCMRQDPDIILLGEIRDLETAEIAFTTALTGHFIFSSLHTNDAPSTIARLLDMRVEPYLISSSLRGVLAQRLVRKLCPDCKESYRPPKRLLDRMTSELRQTPSQAEFYRPKGCEKCSGTGYLGRFGIFELLEVDKTFAELISERVGYPHLLAAARESGMKSLHAEGILSVFRGLTTMSEVLRVTAQGD